MKTLGTNHHGKGLPYSSPSTKIINIAIRNSILQDSGYNTDSDPERDA